MAEPLTTEVFGPGFTQTATHFTIDKADLPGLTAAINNRGEQLLIGIVLRAMARLTPESFEDNLDQSVTITEGLQGITYRSNDAYDQNVLSVNMHKLKQSGPIDPDDY